MYPVWTKVFLTGKVSSGKSPFVSTLAFGWLASSVGGGQF